MIGRKLFFAILIVNIFVVNIGAFNIGSVYQREKYPTSGNFDDFNKTVTLKFPYRSMEYLKYKQDLFHIAQEGQYLVLTDGDYMVNSNKIPLVISYQKSIGINVDLSEGESWFENGVLLKVDGTMKMANSFEKVSFKTS